MWIKHWLVRKFDRLDLKVQIRVANIYYRLLGGQNHRVKLAGDVVKHQFADAVICAPIARIPTPQHFKEATIDFFCWKYTPKIGDVVIDIGAGFGTEALTFSSLVGPAGTVLCVEPHPLISKCLLGTVQGNRLENTRVESVALNGVKGTVQLGNSSLLWESNSIISRSDKVVDVEAITFGELLSRNSLTGAKIDFVKMNIEGAEWPVLQNMVEEISMIQNFAISCHDFKGQWLGKPEFRTYMLVTEFLRNNGFTVSPRADRRPYVADVVYASRI